MPALNCFRDRSAPDGLRKAVLNFHSPTKSSDAKKLIVSAFSSNLAGYQFKADRRTSSVRSANDAEVEDILGIFNVLDAASALEGADISIFALDRLPRLYGPAEINLCAVVDRHTRMDAVLLDLTAVR